MTGLLQFLLVCCLYWSCAASYELEECETNVTMNNVTNSIVYVPNGTVCFECVPDYFGFPFTFIIRDRIVDSSYPLAHTDNTSDADILVVPNTGRVFNTSSATTVKCCEWKQGQCATESIVLNLQATVILYYAFNRPRISGETTVSEGDTLYLSCNGSNSDPLPTLHWVSPDGETVNDTGQLVIMDITRNITGMYTCVATLPNSTMTLNTTVNVTITEGSLFDGWLVRGVGAGVLFLLLCCCVSNCLLIAVCVFKRKQRKKKQYLLRENSDHVGDQHNQMAMRNVQYENVVQSSSANEVTTTQLDAGYFKIEALPEHVTLDTDIVQSPESTPEQAVPTGQYSFIQTLPQHPDVEANTVDSEAHTRPEQTTGDHGWYSPAQMAPPETTREQNGQYCSVPENHTGPVGQYSLIQTVPDSGEPEDTSEVAQTLSHTEMVRQGRKIQKTLVYAEVGLKESPTPRPPNPMSERVQYASIDLSGMVNTVSPPPLPPQTAPTHHDIDSTVCLDQILIQLKEVAPQWRRLGEAVGLEALDDIAEYVGGSESEAMVEVVDGWLAKLHPNKPTWREIADVVESIGHHNLAHSLRQVYISGLLPIQVSDELPESLLVQEAAPPPPLPPRVASPPDDQTPPPIPAKKTTLV